MTGRIATMRAAAAAAALLTAAIATAAEDQAEQILEAAGVRAGLTVRLGCGDGKLTAALCPDDGFLVHGLDTDPEQVAKAREHIRSLKLYGQVSADTFDGKRLPYADNLVNLVVAEDLGDVPMDEVMRVLAPQGVAYVGAKKGSELFSGQKTVLTPFSRTVKPWPEEIDEWTHYLHAADGNAVADDSRAGVPRHAQWIARPLWPRSHEYTPSISAMVSSGGRIFYIMDEGIRGVFDKRLPERWAVYARDAFNGVLLWRRPFSEFGPSQWVTHGHWSCPMSLPRRLVSTGGRVYVTLGYRAPVSVLDAATGATVGVYDDTQNTDEILVHDGILLARCRKQVPNYPAGATPWDVTVRRRAPTDPARLPPASPGDETLVAVDTKTGKVLWKKPEQRMVTLSLAAREGNVCYHTFEELVCLDLANGRQRWRQPSEPWPDLTGTGVTLVMVDDVVLTTSSKGLVARSVDTGEELWRGPRIPRVAPRQPADLLVTDGLVWTGLTPEMPMGTVPKQQSEAPRVSGKAVLGLDPRTGEVRKTVEIGELVTYGHHVRCYRSKGTANYLLWPKRGVEFVDIGAKKGTGPISAKHPSGRSGKLDQSPFSHMRCDWTRGECSYGVMPANGLLYVPPHPCVCFTGVALNGFNAFAARRQSEPQPTPDDERLEKGAAFGNPADGTRSVPATVGSWPMFRHDPRRSGSGGCKVGPNVEPVWRSRIGGRLTQPVVAGGSVLVASVDEHTVYCLGEEDGRPRWTFTAGGRIDSPPAQDRGLVLFGCRDGWVYCLRGSDGGLVWRFRAAPEERRIVAFGQLESPWGVHGSVLPIGGAVYFAAGRSSFLDGGIHLFGLDAATGEVLHRARLVGPWPDVTEDRGQPYTMEGAKTDVLVSDGEHLYMFQNRFDLALNRIETKPRGAGGDRVTGHYLTSTSGLLDDTLHDRFYWFHNRLWPGSHFACAGPKSGHILVFDQSGTYGQRAFSRRAGLSPKFTPGEGYLLFADGRDTAPRPSRGSSRGTEYRPSAPPRWSAKVPIRAIAMVLTENVLFLAGPPDVVPAEDPYAAFDGRLGARLWAVSREDGTRLAEHRLDSIPVFDGLIAAQGRLYLSTQDGEVLCMQ